MFAACAVLEHRLSTHFTEGTDGICCAQDDLAVPEKEKKTSTTKRQQPKSSKQDNKTGAEQGSSIAEEKGGSGEGAGNDAGKANVGRKPSQKTKSKARRGGNEVM
jgi:hypothetical protein